MQIQRIQTLWLLLAFFALAAFVFLPFGTLDVTEATTDNMRVTAPLHVVDFAGLLIPAVLATLLPMLAILCYNKLRLQRQVVITTIMMQLVTAAITVYVLLRDAHFGWTLVLVALGVLFSALALKGIAHDKKLLESYDRLR